MKLCPSCRAQYADDTLNYCLSDGTPLVQEASPQDPQKTLVLPAFQEGQNPKTQKSNLYAQTEQQPAGMATTRHLTSAGRPKRSLIPWVIGGAILLFGLIGIGLFAAFMISGAGNKQSSTNNSYASSNSSVNQNSNNNQPQSTPSPVPPYAAFTGRTGRYEGKGLNTTYNVSGTIRLDIKTINADTGNVSSMLTSGGNLCGDAPLTGKMTEGGKMSLSGTITCKASDYVGSMTVRCQFAATDMLSCTYSLNNPKYKPVIQHGNFKVTKR